MVKRRLELIPYVVLKVEQKCVCVMAKGWEAGHHRAFTSATLCVPVDMLSCFMRFPKIQRYGQRSTPATTSTLSKHVAKQEQGERGGRSDTKAAGSDPYLFL